MKRASTILCCILISNGMLFLNKIHAQCQVSHTTGTTMINSINISVTSSGSVDTISNCQGQIGPYWIGNNWAGINSDGSYTFQFSPAVDSVTLDFSGINDFIIYGISNKEIVKLFVNGLHYQIPSAGNLSDCDSLAILTPSGNITGCGQCDSLAGSSGWTGTTISGPISSLTVLDSIVAGSPNGSVFSLYICNSITASTHDANSFKLNIFPNPVDDLLTVEGINLQTANISMINLFGQKMVIDPSIQNNQMLINCSDLPTGIYFILIERDGLVVTRKISIK